MNWNKRLSGYTLVEIMVVVAIIAILATLAIPSYLDSVRKSRRADAQAAITTVQLEQQKLRASCRFFGGTIGAANNCAANAGDSTVGVAATSPDGWYTIAISDESATGYTVTATGTGDQVNDDEGDVVCTMVLTVSAANPNGVRTPADCWN